MTSGYHRHDPVSTILHRVIKENWLSFVANHESGDRFLPHHVRREFESFLHCGILANGFLRLKCASCIHEKLVAFSCKKRGFCNSCNSKKSSESSAFLTDWVLPKVRIRQWVLSVPIPMRYFMARNPDLMGVVLRIYIRAISGFQRDQAKEFGFKNGESGSVTLIQRFGSSLNLNPHFHTLFIEAVYRKNKDELQIQKLRAPSTVDIQILLEVMQKRMVRALTKRGYLNKESSVKENEDDSSLLDLCQGASVQGKIGLGENANEYVRKVGSFGGHSESAMRTGRRSASIQGFSLHANTAVEPDKYEGLEKLCRYVTRPTVAESRLSEDRNGRIVYRFKKPWTDGTEAVSFTPLQFIEKLVALIPEPKSHLTRFHGVLAPNSKLRALIVPAPPERVKVKSEEYPDATRDPRKLNWAELLKRIYKIDLETCPDCGGALRFIATIMDREVVIKILNHLNLPVEVQKFAPARAPPQSDFF